MYKSEVKFSDALHAPLQGTFGMVQRIESATTNRGIPDLYLRDVKGEVWVELKNMPKVSINDAVWTVPWRKGQRAWALKYRVASKMGAWTYTVCALKDGFLVIPMINNYTRNVVMRHDAFRCTKLKDICDLLKSRAKYYEIGVG